MAKCINGIGSIEFENAAERNRFDAYLQAYANDVDRAYEAYLAEKIERDAFLADELSKYTLPGFTPSQQHQVLSGLTFNLGQAILDSADDPKATNAVNQLFSNEFYALRLQLTDAHKRGDTALANEYLKVLKNWDAIKGMIVSNLKTLGINIKGSSETVEEATSADDYSDALSNALFDAMASEMGIDDNFVVEGEESNYERTKWEDDAIFQIQAKDRASSRLRMFMGRIPEVERNVNGDLVVRRGYLGLTKYIPFDTLWENTTAFLAGREPDFDVFLSELQNSGNASLTHLATMLSQADERIKSEFMTSMSKFYVDMMLVTWSPTYTSGTVTGFNTRLMRSNRNSVADAVLSSWITNQKTSPLVTFVDGEMMIDSVRVKEIRDSYAEMWRAVQGKGMNEDKLDLVQNMLASLGITMTKAQLATLEQKSRAVFNGPFDYMFDPQEPKSFVSTLFDGFSPRMATGEESLFALANPLVGSVGGRIKKLAEFVGTESDQLMTPSYRDVERKMVHPYQDHHLLSNTIRKLRSDKSHIEQLVMAPFSSRSLWAARLLESESDRSLLSMTYVDGMRKQGSRRAQKRSNMSKAEQHLYAVTLFQNAQFKTVGKSDVMASFIVPTMSDKSVSPIISFVKQNVDVSIEDGEVTGLSKKTVDLVMNGVLAEATRIQHFQDKLEGNMGENFKAYQDGAKNFYLHPWLNKDVMTEEDAAIVWGQNGSLLLTTEAVGVMRRLTVKAYIQKISDLQKLWKDVGVVSEENGRLTPMMSLPHLNTIGPKDMPGKIAAAAADFAINYAVFYSEYFMLIAGDPAQHFKNDVEQTLDNLQKRLAKDIAPTLRGRWGKDATFRKVTIGDRVVDSKNRAMYRKRLGEDLYADIESTDAQEYTTLEEHINVMRAYGKIAEPVYKSIMAKIRSNRGGYFELSDDERRVILQPMKPLTVNMRHLDYIEVDGNQVPVHMNTVTYTKSSSFPLVPELTRGLEIDKLRVAMEKGRIDRAAHVSADKLGIKTTKNIYTGDGKIQDSIEFDDYQEIPREGFGLQQEMPVKKLEISTVSQMNKLLFDGIRELKGFRFNGNDYSGAQLESLKEDIRKRLFDAGSNALRKELGLVPNGDGSYRFENLDKVREVLMREAKARGWSKSDIESLELTEDGSSFIIPLAFSHASPRIESLLLSMMKKIVSHPKVFGKGFVQSSSAGFEAVGGEQNIVWVGDYDPSKGLSHMTWDKDGKVKPAQIIIPWYFSGTDLKDYIGNDGRLDLSLIDPDVLKMIGARIPNQGHSSMGAFEIVGFVDPAFYSLAIVPDEIVTQMGSDFDIDKLYGYLTQYQIDLDLGKIRKLPLVKDPDEKMTTAQLKQVYADIHWSVLTHPEVAERVMSPLERPDLRIEKDLIREAKGISELRAPIFFDTQIDDHIKNRSGKELIAKFSLYSTAQSVLQPYNVRFSRNEAGFSKSDAFQFDGKTFDRLSGTGEAMYDGERRTKAQNIASLQSAAVDNAKENILGFLNLNQTTAPIAGLMAMLETQDGEALSLAHIARFLSQPAVSMVVDRIEQYRSSMRTTFVADPVEAAISDVYDELFGKEEGIVSDLTMYKGSFSAKQLLNMIEDWSKYESLSKKQKTDLISKQLKVLELFRSLQDGASAFDRFRRALLFADSNGSGMSIPEMNDQREEAGNIQTLGFDFDATLLESEYFKVAEHTLEMGSAYFNQLFGYSSIFFRYSRNQLASGLGLEMNAEDQQRFMNSIRSFLYTQAGVFGDSNEELKRLTIGDNSLAHRVNEAKDTEWGSKNYFLQRLQANISESIKTPNFVEYMNSKAARLDEEEILRSWASMLISPDVTQRKLAADLVAYSYLSGGRFGPTSFSQHVPMAYLVNIGFDESLRNISLNDPVLSERFVTQYLQHNPTLTPNIRGNKKLISKITSSTTVLIHPDEQGIDELRVGDSLAMAFHVGKAGGAASLWINRGEQADGNMLFEKVDLLGKPNFYEYDGAASIAKTIFPDQRVRIPENNKRVVSTRKEEHNSNTDRGESQGQPVSGITDQIREMVSIEYPSMTGVQRAQYALDNISYTKAKGIVPILRAAVESLGSDFSFEFDDAESGRWDAGKYDPKTNSVAIFQNNVFGKAEAETVVIHELLHAVTLERLQNTDDPIVQRLVSIRSKLSNHIKNGSDGKAYKDFLKVMAQPFESRRNLTQEEVEKFYPLINVEEFVVALFENPEFVSYVKDFKMDGSDGKTVLENIIATLSNLISRIAKEFGIDIPADSAVREAMEAALQIFPSDISSTRRDTQVPDNKDTFQYYGAKYTILLKRDSHTEELYPYAVEDYKGKTSQMFKMIEAYETDPDVDPQSGKKFRNLETVEEEVDNPRSVEEDVEPEGAPTSKAEAEILRNESPFLSPATRDFGTTVDQIMKKMTKEQRELFRNLRREGLIRTKC